MGESRGIRAFWRAARRAMVGIWLGCVLALGLVGAGRSVSILYRPLDSPDFATYYLAARMLDLAPSAIYDTMALNTLTSNDGPREALLYSYPPFLAGVMRPLGQLPYPYAVGVWLILELLCMIGGVIGLRALTRWPGGRAGAIAMWGAVCLFTPAHEAILLGQVTPILLLLVVLAALLLDKSNGRKDFLAGGLLGVATLIKIFPAILLVYLLLRRRWWAIVGGVFGGVICILAGLAWGGGWANTWYYFADFLPALYARYVPFVHVSNQSLTAAFLRTMGNVPLARALGWASELTVLAVTGLVTFMRRPQHLIYEFALFSMLPMLVTSAVQTHIYVLALLPMAVLARSWNHSARWLAVPVMLAFLLMIVNSYSVWLDLPLATWVPFGLMGALILWGALLYQITRRADTCEPE